MLIYPLKIDKIVIFHSYVTVYQRVSLFVTLTAPSSAALISSVSRSIPTVETFQGLYPQTPGLYGQKGANSAGFVANFPMDGTFSREKV
jgi:hypothetical protein